MFGRNRISGSVVFAVGLACAVSTMWACKPSRPVDPAADSPGSGLPSSLRKQESPVVATIGDRAITFDEVSASLDALPVFVRMRYQAPERRLEFLEAYLEFQVVALAAEAEGLGSDARVVDQVKAQLVRDYIRDNVDMKLKTADIPDEEIRSWYEQNMWDFSHPQQKRVLRILVADEKEAARVAYRVKSLVSSASGDPVSVFREHVVKSSVEPAAKITGGDIGLFPDRPGSPARVPETVAAAASAINALHEVVGPVKAEDGYSILMLAAVEPAVEKSFEEARTEAAGAILEARRKAARKALVDKLIGDREIVINRNELARLAAAVEASRTAGAAEVPR